MIPYLRRGIVFGFNHVTIHFFDYLKGSNKGMIINLKNKYRNAIESHRYNLMLIQAYERRSNEFTEEIFDDYLDACKRDVDIIPIILECIDELIEISKNNKNGIEMPDLYYDKYKTAGCNVFVKLERYYTNNGMYVEAIEVCDKAIACGYLDDGTKSGMLGRKKRIQKKFK